MPAPDDTAAFGSFEWAKQIITDANAGVLAMSKPIEGSPSLDQPLRSKERAALDIAVNRLRAIEARAGGPSYHAMTDVADEARRALRCIADLVPEAVKGESQ